VSDWTDKLYTEYEDGFEFPTAREVKLMVAVVQAARIARGTLSTDYTPLDDALARLRAEVER